jgi:hypothetical protein
MRGYGKNLIHLKPVMLFKDSNLDQDSRVSDVLSMDAPSIAGEAKRSRSRYHSGELMTVNPMITQ